MGRGTTKTIKEIKYLTADEIILIHDNVLEQFGGGETGIYLNGKGKLESMISRMREGYFDYQPFDSLIQKTAFMFQSILIYHPFVDGMKRTGIFSSLAFLLRNDYLFTKKDVEEEIKFAVNVADNMVKKDSNESLDIICDWFHERIIPLDDKKSIIEHLTKAGTKFKCPRCGNTEVTLKNPSCRDCNAQLIEYKMEIDGIVEKKSIPLLMRDTKGRPLLTTKSKIRGLYPD